MMMIMMMMMCAFQTMMALMAMMHHNSQRTSRPEIHWIPLTLSNLQCTLVFFSHEKELRVSPTKFTGDAGSTL